jgi:hypothetical protein
MGISDRMRKTAGLSYCISVHSLEDATTIDGTAGSAYRKGKKPMSTTIAEDPWYERITVAEGRKC